MSAFWKLRHKPSGLFFKPAKHRAKAHLSKNGKVYQTRQRLACIVGGSYNHPLPKTKGSWSRDNYERRAVVPADWEFVPFSVTEGTPEPCT